MLTKNILVVDDEPKTRNGVQKILENWSQGKYSIYTAANGEEAIAMMEKTKIHILLSDIRMPEITGLQLLTILKEKCLSPVVIFISAYTEFTYAHEALRLGVINYLLKPISKKDLIEAVEEAVKTLEKKERAGIIEKVVDEKIIDANTKIDSTSETIRAAITYIDQHLKDEINQKDVAAHVHLNPSYLSVLFKEQVNVTFSEYVTRRRIQRAKELLISSSLPISEIAEEVGYKTAKYFIKMFKDMEGITPSAYRKINHERAF
jgi:two-component system, response regulator YesN